MLSELVEQLRSSLGILQKQDIQSVARSLGSPGESSFSTADHPILLGDDCAAIPDQSGYQLLAAEGMWPQLVETEPWFAGWCAVQVNVSDIYAMGGYPIAVVDTIWGTSPLAAAPVLAGIKAAAQVYNVPIVGGHTNYHSPYNALSVAILGRATHLITSFNAQPGDVILAAIDLRGQPHATHPFWNASQGVEPARLRGDLAVLPHLAKAGLCDAGKDISMGGIVGTLLMLLETSGCGAVLDLEAIPCPESIPLERWLLFFPSYGFLLSVRPQDVAAVQQQFQCRNLACLAIAEVQSTHQLILRSQTEKVLFWDLSQKGFTGFSPK